MTDHRCDMYLRFLGLLVRLHEGDLMHCISEAGREEIRRALRCDVPESKPSLVKLTESDE